MSRPDDARLGKETFKRGGEPNDRQTVKLIDFGSNHLVVIYYRGENLSNFDMKEARDLRDFLNLAIEWKEE